MDTTTQGVDGPVYVIAAADHLDTIQVLANGDRIYGQLPLGSRGVTHTPRGQTTRHAR